MAIEKMVMVDIIGQRLDLEAVAGPIVFSGSMHAVKAVKEIAATKKLDISEEKLERHIREKQNEIDYSALSSRINRLEAINASKKVYAVNENEIISSISELEKAVEHLETELLNIKDRLNQRNNHLNAIRKEIQKINLIEKISPYIKSLIELNNFEFKIYRYLINANKKYTLKDFQGMVFDINKNEKYKILLVITVKNSADDFKDYFSETGLETIEIPPYYKDNIFLIKRRLQSEEKAVVNKIAELDAELKNVCDENLKQMCIVRKSLKFQLEVIKLTENSAYTNEFFYLSGWVPESKIAELRDRVKVFEDRLIIEEKDVKAFNDDLVPPTKLKNKWLVRPFEKMVNMYGVPSYKETDPTGFLAVTYMIMFGAMFGDLGQGFVLVLIGLYLMKKKVNSRPNLGAVLARIGVSSSIFGLLYGSVFGFENVIPAILLRPMEKISQTLILAVVLGCIFLAAGFVYSLINNTIKNNVEEGIFGKNGVAGMLLYLSAVGFVLLKFTGSQITASVPILIMALLLAAILFKQPAANILTGKRPLYKNGAADYFIEQGFGLIETILGMLSNTISFIRIGAFALNHVGLFMAFSILAQMTHSTAGGVIMYILGNIVILTLECLIVFIQGLRLEYYELFGKYYEGSGIPFEPAAIKTK